MKIFVDVPKGKSNVVGIIIPSPLPSVAAVIHVAGSVNIFLREHTGRK